MRVEWEWDYIVSEGGMGMRLEMAHSERIT